MKMNKTGSLTFSSPFNINFSENINQHLTLAYRCKVKAIDIGSRYHAVTKP